MSDKGRTASYEPKRLQRVHPHLRTRNREYDRQKLSGQLAELERLENTPEEALTPEEKIRLKMLSGNKYRIGWYRIPHMRELIDRKLQYDKLKSELEQLRKKNAEAILEAESMIQDLGNRGNPYAIFTVKDAAGAVGNGVRVVKMIKEGVIPEPYKVESEKRTYYYFDELQIALLCEAFEKCGVGDLDCVRNYLRPRWGWRVYDKGNGTYKFKRLGDGA